MIATTLKPPGRLTPDVFFDFSLFAEQFLRILVVDPTTNQKQLVPFRLNAAQRHYLAHRTSRDLILKARQLGFSTLVQGYFFHKAVTSTATTITLAHTDDATQKLRRLADRFYVNMPVNFRPARRYNNARVATYSDFDSECLIATAGSVHTGRAGTYTHVHGSEVAFWKDAELLLAGLIQGGDPDVVLESTPNGASGYFYNLCMEALDGNNDWKLHFYPWWWEPTYRVALGPGEELVFTDEEKALVAKHGLTPAQIKWRRQKRRELRDLFSQEYPEDPVSCFLMSGSSYFGDLIGVFTAPSGAVYHDDHAYFAGLDWGQQEDFTVCSVIDATTRCQVVFERMNRMSWGEMRRRVRDLCRRWGVRTLLVEANAMGTTNIEELEREFREAGVGTRLVAFTTTNTTKHDAAATLHDWLHEAGGKLLDDPQQRREMRAFTSHQNPVSLTWTLQAPPGEHDDFVIANMLAVVAAQRYRAGGGIWV